MDESLVRKHAEGHGKAVVDGDMRTAGSDLEPEVISKAGDVMKSIPKNLRECDVSSVVEDGAEWTAEIRYVGDGEVVVQSRWAEREGRPKIVGLEVL